MRLKYRFGEFELNPATRELLRNGTPVPLRPRSLECLVYLIAHRDRAVGRDELISAVWGRIDTADTVVAQTLLRARKALDDTGQQQVMIRTVPRFGYRWVATVQEVAMAPDADAGLVEVAPIVEDDAECDIEPEAETEVEAVPTIDAAPPPTTRSARTQLALPIFVVLLLAIGIGAWWFLRPDKPGPTTFANDAVLVMPFAVAPADSETAWVRLGAMDYMAARLRSSGIKVIPSEQAMRVGAAIEGDAPDVARGKLLALGGARWIAQPEAFRGKDGWRVRLRVFDKGAERAVEARGDSALAATAEAADAWLRQLGGQGGGGPPPGPLAERLHRIDAEILAGRLPEARRLVRMSTPEERKDPRFLVRDGKIEFRAGNFDEAGDRFRQAMDRVAATEVDTKIGALVGLATVARAQNDLDEADRRYSETLALLESQPASRIDARMAGVTYMGRGIIRAQRGDVDAGVKDMGQARVWLQRSGDRITLGVAGHNIGYAESLRGDYLQALHEFDRSIETFERFHVGDYLANSLQEKAKVQLALARPAEALDTVRRADRPLATMEDDALASEILATQARVLIALGRTREATDALAAMHARGVADADPRMIELSLRLQLAKGDFAQARRLAARGPAEAGVGPGLRLAGVQAALRGQDLPLAQTWLAARSAEGEPSPTGANFAVELSRALIARAAGDQAGALALAEKAAARVGDRASPDSIIQAGVMQALTLLDARNATAASALMGELEKYTESDYRVAWVMASLYHALGDARAAASARTRAGTLSGERDLSIEPIL
jgi:DNA-binding winged helix-turn-helix (wHTH) protein/tetratricopeptide (TPR) repeat protein